MTAFDPPGSNIHHGSLCDDEDGPSTIDKLFAEFEEKLNAALTDDDTDSDEESDAEEGCAHDETTLKDLYSQDFDMAAAIGAVADLPQRVENILQCPCDDDACSAWQDDAAFERTCVEVMEKIIRMDKCTQRKDALEEAAKELVAVRLAGQSKKAEDVHERVLKEFLTASDEEYLIFRKHIVGE